MRTTCSCGGYWGTKGPFPAVEFHPVPDAATRVADLRSGKSDFIVTITPDHAAELGDGQLAALDEKLAKIAADKAAADAAEAQKMLHAARAS